MSSNLLDKAYLLGAITELMELGEIGGASSRAVNCRSGASHCQALHDSQEKLLVPRGRREDERTHRLEIFGRRYSSAHLELKASRPQAELPKCPAWCLQLSRPLLNHL